MKNNGDPKRLIKINNRIWFIILIFLIGLFSYSHGTTAIGYNANATGTPIAD